MISIQLVTPFGVFSFSFSLFVYLFFFLLEKEKVGDR